MRKILLLALMAMLALALYAPAALAQDDGGYDDDFDDGGGVATPAQHDDDSDDDGYDDDSGAPLPSTGGPALLPIAGAALLIGASSVGIGAALKRRSGR